MCEEKRSNLKQRILAIWRLELAVEDFILSTHLFDLGIHLKALSFTFGVGSFDFEVQKIEE